MYERIPMELKNIMITKAIVSIGFGIPMLLIPATLTSLYGLSLHADGIVMARLYGAVMCGNFFVTWFSRNDPGSISLRAVVLYMFVYNGLGFIVTLIAVLSAVMDPFGWTAVGIYLFFTVSYGYYQFIKPPAS